MGFIFTVHFIVPQKGTKGGKVVMKSKHHILQKGTKDQELHRKKGPLKRKAERQAEQQDCLVTSYQASLPQDPVSPRDERYQNQTRHKR